MNVINIKERQRIDIDSLGTPEERESFIRNNHRVLGISAKEAWFNVAGIFQVGKTCCIVNPWFHIGLSEDRHDDSRSLAFLDYISETKEISRLVQLDKCDPSKYAQEIIIHSFLKALSNQLQESLKKNYFMEKQETLPTIKGKWLVHQDIRRGPRPTSFECQFNDAEPKNPILVLVKSFLDWLHSRISTRLNTVLCSDTSAMLSHIEHQRFAKKLIEEAGIYVYQNDSGEEWSRILESIENLFDSIGRASPLVGLSYMFEMDRFFEELTEDLLYLHRIPFSKQERLPLLGGGKWHSKDSKATASELSDSSIQEKSSRMHSKPDLIVEFDKSLWVCDCKYKPFFLPLHDKSKKKEYQKMIGRDDRNQLLSFLLSFMPRNAPNNVRFAIIYPDLTTETISRHQLVFDKFKMQFSDNSRQLVQSADNLPSDDQFSIEFIGVNVDWILKKIISRQKFITNDFEVYDGAA